MIVTQAICESCVMPPRRSARIDGEVIFAFLDDVHALCVPERARESYTLGRRARGTSRRSSQSNGGIGPVSVEPSGVKILGSPVGTDDFHLEAARERSDEEAQLWRAIPSVPDLQCAWHGSCWFNVQAVVATTSSAMSRAQGHNIGMREVMERLLEGVPGNLCPEARSRTVGYVAHEDWFAFSMPHGACGLLGFVG